MSSISDIMYQKIQLGEEYHLMSLLGYPIEINHYQDFYHFFFKFTIINSIHYKLILIWVYLVYDLVVSIWIIKSVSIWIQAPAFVAQYLLVSRKKKKFNFLHSWNHNKKLKLNFLHLVVSIWSQCSKSGMKFNIFLVPFFFFPFLGTIFLCFSI